MYEGGNQLSIHAMLDSFPTQLTTIHTYFYSLFVHRYEQLVSGVKKFDSDGINSVKYEVRALERKVLYTWVLVDVKHESVSKQRIKNDVRKKKIVACGNSLEAYNNKIQMFFISSHVEFSLSLRKILLFGPTI